MRRVSATRLHPSSVALVAAVLLLAAAPLAAAQPAYEITAVPSTARALSAPVAAGSGLVCTSAIGNVCLLVRCMNCNQSIPDLGDRTQTITVTNAGLASINLKNCIIRDLNAGVEIDHSHVGDLSVELSRPNGSGAMLYFPPGACSATRVDALFDDEAPNLANLCGIVNGIHVRPDEPLSDFDGQNPVGNWTMKTEDLLGGDTGFVRSWGFAADSTCEAVTSMGPCIPDSTTLCLSNGRFRVRTQWTTTQGTNGNGRAVPLSADTGYFWFFSATNVEMVVKVLNACSFANRIWVFAGGLTNVDVVMTVTDTQTGIGKIYHNPQGAAFQPIQDTQAFATCP